MGSALNVAEFQRMFLKVILSLVALALFMVLAPAASAHGAHPTDGALSVAMFPGHHHGGRTSVTTARDVAMPHVQVERSTSNDAAETCSNNVDHGQADLSGCCCCGGIATCCGSSGAVTASSDDPPALLPLMTKRPFTTTALSDGIDINPTDPPPRTIV
jgi:hypothetical protein